MVTRISAATRHHQEEASGTPRHVPLVKRGSEDTRPAPSPATNDNGGGNDGQSGKFKDQASAGPIQGDHELFTSDGL
jgi:hypothetical protein